MDFTLVGHGTRGDVQPYVCLGFELRRRGHRVKVVAPEDSRQLVEKAGLSFFPVELDVRASLAEPEARAMLANGHLLAFSRWLEREEKRNRERLHTAWLEGTRDADVIVAHPLVEDLLAAMGAVRRIPVVPLYFYPFPPNRSLPSPLWPGPDLGPLNGLTHRLVLGIAWNVAKDGVQLMRRRLGLPLAKDFYYSEVRRRRLPCFLAFSTRLVPRPSDYPEEHRVVPSLVPSPELKKAWGEFGLDEKETAWLEAGTAPLYLGLGSMPILEPAKMLALLERVCERRELRAIVGAGWSQFSNTGSSRVRIVPRADHAALLARCGAAIHHGGAGTTYAVARAGVPSLVTSILGDQPFWGRRLEKLGVGFTFPFRKFDERALEGALDRLLQPEVRERAARLGEELRTERGTEELADALLEAAPSLAPPEL